MKWREKVGRIWLTTFICIQSYPFMSVYWFIYQPFLNVKNKKKVTFTGKTLIQKWWLTAKFCKHIIFHQHEHSSVKIWISFVQIEWGLKSRWNLMNTIVIVHHLILFDRVDLAANRWICRFWTRYTLNLRLIIPDHYTGDLVFYDHPEVTIFFND